jgi:hypothetical protein
VTDEARYTLEEARRVLTERECGTRGHVFDVHVRASGDPTLVLCSRCGQSWPVAG